MNPAKGDHVRFRLLGAEGETKGITDIICDLLNCRVLIIVREDDRITLFLQSEDVSAQVGGSQNGVHEESLRK